MLDDEFFAKRPENLKLMGNPRPELDQAWDEFLDAGSLLTGTFVHMETHEFRRLQLQSTKECWAQGRIPLDRA